MKDMKRVVLSIFALIVLSVQTLTYADETSELRGYSPIVLPKGAFVKVVNQRTISTAIADENDEVTFIVPTDVWCADAKIIPKEAIFSGYIEELNEPVQGTNGAVKLRITKLTLPDNSEYTVDAYINYKGDTTIGGELTAPLEYTKMPHYIRYPHVHRGVLQYVPGEKRFFGEHLVIKPGAELVLMFNEDFNAPIIDEE